MKTLKQKHAELCDLIGENEVKRLLHSWYDRVLKRERKRRSEVQSASELQPVDEFCRLVLEDLHQRTGITYRLGKETKTTIAARRNEGFGISEFVKVNEIKCHHWLEDPKMINYLHPSTLYRPKNFDKYLTQWEIWQREIKLKKQKAEQKKAEIKQQESESTGDEMTPEEAAEWREKVHGILGNISKRKRMRT